MHDSLTHVFLCYLATILFRQLAFLEFVEERKIHEKMCDTHVSILGLLANDPATVPDGLPWTSCDFM